jgi:hypothetical protein
MHAAKSSAIFRTALALAAITFTLAVTAQAQTHTLKVLHAFSGKWDGGEPVTGVIFDASGNIYGTAAIGGNINACQGVGCGLVYKLSPTTGGAWQETSVFRFQSLTTGALPTGNLLFDSAGNLFGVDSEGGTSSNCALFQAGCGVVFELTPTSTSWHETVVQTFDNGTGGGDLMGGMVADAAGNLYGAAFIGGNLSDCLGQGCGNVFRLSPNGSGGWTETVLYNFTGGADGCGVVFELSPTTSGPWTETVLHTFIVGTGDGFNPSGIIRDAAGNLFGTTPDGGIANFGAVFEVTP